MQLNIVFTLLATVVAGTAIDHPSPPLGLAPSQLTPTVQHYKEPMGGYTKGSPLYKRQQLRVEMGVVDCPGQLRGDASHCSGKSEEHAGEEHEVPKSAISIAWMLMGAVIFVMTLFYLVNSHLNGIRRGTWKALSNTVSIFASVLVYSHVKESLAKMFMFTEGAGSTQIFGMVLFLLFYVLAEIVLFLLKRRGHEMRLLAVGTLMAHMTAFAAIYAFANLQEIPWVEERGWLVALVVVFAAVIIMCLEFVSKKVRNYIAMKDGTMNEREKAWIEQAEETENDVLSICTGFLTMQVFRYYITGKVQTYEAAEPPPPGLEVWHWSLLLLCSILCGIATFLSTMYVNRAVKEHHIPESVVRYLKVTQIYFSMCMAWSMLYWGEWVLYSSFNFTGNRMRGVLFVALLLTAICVICIFVLENMAVKMEVGKGRRSMRNCEFALGVVVGFSWEKCFDVALEVIAEAMPAHSSMAYSLLLGGSLLAVLPAWLLYVLPKAMES